MKYKVVESFVSINGEGMKVGELAHFIRFAGCNLECSYCDTKWANEEDVDFVWMREEEIYRIIKKEGIKNITLTGGEPLLQDNIKELLAFLDKDETIEIEIETNGSIDLTPFKSQSFEHVSFTMDYKLEDSQMESRMFIGNLNQLSKKDIVKFVVSSEKELEKVYQIIDAYKLTEKCSVLLSPVYGLIEPERIVTFMKDKRMNGVKMQLQLHKIIWDPMERGV